MKILHLGNSLLAGAPSHLSGIINKYTKHESICVAKKKFTNVGLNNLDWKYNYINPDDNTLNSLIEWCDIIHFHNLPKYAGKDYTHKPSIVQFHSQPEHHGNYIPNTTYSNFNGRKLVIAQYHPRFYTDAKIVPNMIDIWNPVYTDNLNKNNDRLKVFFGYAWHSKGWSDKGVEEITKILESFKDSIDFDIITNTSYEEMLFIKSKADIVIGDCITGSYHLNDLEGAACGAVVFNRLDDKTMIYLGKVSNSCAIPFQQSNIDSLASSLEFAINNKDWVNIQGRTNRLWMQKYWNPKNKVNLYINFYKEILNGIN